MTKVTVEVPATTANVGPGFDCVGLALRLHNRVEAEALDTPSWEVTIEGEGVSELPRTRQNLVAQAMRHLFERAPAAPPGARLHMVNGIPLSSGLGSSAAARVAGLVAANELCDRPFGQAELARFAADLEGHPDNVVPALYGGLVVAVLDTDGLTHVRFDPPADMTAVVALPAQKLATSEARRALPNHYSREDAVYNLGRAALLVASLVSGDRAGLSAAMQDRIHQPYRLGLIPGAPRVLEAACVAGALGAVISGAGPSLLALCDGEVGAVAEAMKKAWRQADVEARILLLGLDPHGTVVR